MSFNSIAPTIRKSFFPISKSSAYLIGLIVLTLCLRLVYLHSLPPGLWYDEAINGLDSVRIYHGHEFPIFFTSYDHPREPIFLYFIAILYPIFGVSAFTLRLASAIIGSITVILFYFFIRYLFNQRIAIIASFLMATAKWHLVFSRLSFRTILTPMFIILVCYFLFRALNERKRVWYILTGISMGIGMYTYLAFRLVPLLLLVVVLYHWYVGGRGETELRPKPGRPLLVIFLVWLIVFMPLLVDYVTHPFHLFGRTEEISVFQNGIGDGIKIIGSNILKVGMMFSFPGYGDPEPKHNTPGEPELPLVLSIFLVIGFIIALRKVCDTKYFLIILWFVLLLLPSIFSQGAPNTLRTTGTLPALYALIAVGFNGAYTLGLNKLKSKRHLWLNIVAIVILLYSATIGVYQYFYWANLPMTRLAFNSAEVELGKQIGQWSLQSRSPIYLPKVVAEHPTVKFSAYPFDYHDYETLNPQPNSIYLVIDPNTLEQLQSQFPEGNIIRKFEVIPGRTWAIAYKTYLMKNIQYSTLNIQF